MTKIPMSEALAQLPANTAEVLHHIFKQNLSDDFLVDMEAKKIYINFPTPQVILDIHATGATLDPETFILTVNRENGEPFSVDLAKLAEIHIQNGELSAAVLGGKGTKNDPLTADVKLSTKAGNLIKKDEKGALLAELPAQNSLIIRDLFGQKLGADGGDIKVVLYRATEENSNSNEAEMMGVTYTYNNGFTSTFLEIKNFPAETMNATFTQVGGLSGNAVDHPEHTVVAQGDGKYTHRFTFSSIAFDGASTAPLRVTIDGIAVNKTLNHTSSTNDGGYIYEG